MEKLLCIITIWFCIDLACSILFIFPSIIACERGVVYTRTSVSYISLMSWSIEIYGRMHETINMGW